MAADEEHDSPHHVSVSGGLVEFEKETGTYLGLDYEYQFDHRYALGGYYETTFGDVEIEAIGVAGTLRFAGGWKALAGLGVERKLGGGHNKALAKLGVGYEYHVGHYSVGPVLSVDAIEDFSRVVYLGLQLGRGF